MHYAYTGRKILRISCIMPVLCKKKYPLWGYFWDFFQKKYPLWGYFGLEMAEIRQYFDENDTFMCHLGEILSKTVIFEAIVALEMSQNSQKSGRNGRNRAINATKSLFLGCISSIYGHLWP